ncbi:MAG TPA: hypothetical protein PKD52_10280 [Clostridiales bacterium]|nr:hypothetical protein [Clostridiales bacterium]
MNVKEPLWKQLKEEVAEDFSLLSLKEFQEHSSICYLVTGETIGSDEAEHGLELMVDYFTTMANQRFFPEYIILLHSAVKLLRRDSPLHAVLTELENSGTAIFASALSVAHYHLEGEIDPLFPAQTGRLLRILHSVDKVITL